jgi:hypothetical protein
MYGAFVQIGRVQVETRELLVFSWIVLEMQKYSPAVLIYRFQDFCQHYLSHS